MKAKLARMPRCSTQVNRHRRAEQDRLLRDAKRTLAQWQRLHVLSVAVGRAEQCGLADGDLFADALTTCRDIVEAADRLCADIDRSLTP